MDLLNYPVPLWFHVACVISVGVVQIHFGRQLCRKRHPHMRAEWWKQGFADGSKVEPIIADYTTDAQRAIRDGVDSDERTPAERERINHLQGIE